jgi:hypothetical protein
MLSSSSLSSDQNDSGQRDAKHEAARRVSEGPHELASGWKRTIQFKSSNEPDRSGSEHNNGREHLSELHQGYAKTEQGLHRHAADAERFGVSSGTRRKAGGFWMWYQEH